MHDAVTARMSADEPEASERLDLLNAWVEAGTLIDQPTSGRN